ncbi:MAG TPA: NAD(P)-binding protein, partial [Verrucomicrobiae bacterium]|nr:NAD(P)-binding protein [Verrucomicrobiae bacterium]
MQTNPIVIIGAGLTGLSCAHHLGGGYLLVEKELEPGGIVRTRIRQNSFYCDGTGHWLHLRNAAMKELVRSLLPDDLVEHERKAVIFSHGVFTQYPFQANTYGLPREVILECLLGLLKAKHPEDFGQKTMVEPPKNFQDWIVRAFGEGIAKHFMVPYNQKLLGVKLTELMPAFAERFIPRPSTEDVIKGALGFSRESL